RKTAAPRSPSCRLRRYLRRPSSASIRISRFPHCLFNLFLSKKGRCLTCPFSGIMEEGKRMEYICYCDRVTEEDIIRAMENGARSLKEIKAATGAMSHCDCANKN